MFFLLLLIFKRVSSRSAIYYFLSPGGYFGELSTIGMLSQLINNAIIIFLNLLGVKVVLVGVSYERLGPKYSKIMRIRSKFLHKHFVRDKQSYDYLCSLKVHCSGIMPDLAFNLKPLSYPVVHSKNSILFSFRSDQFEFQKPLV